MYAAAETAADLERTAFRKAEKRYKLYKSQPCKSSRKRQSYKEVDLSDVFDFRAILESFERGGEIPHGVFRFECHVFHHPVFCFIDRPGFYFIPGALTIEEQVHWIRESLMTFPQPPNRTNHTAIYGPIFDLFNAVRNKQVLIEKEYVAADLETGNNPGEKNQVPHKFLFSEASDISYKEEACKSIAAPLLLRKLRWSTLGLQFDWSKRNYDVTLRHNKIPDALCLLAKKLALPAIPSGEEFQPEAAIVNYFGPSDMLGGHLDDMEADWSKPIVSISLGCKAIFLLGGKSREDPPVAMFLRSGDIVLMAGQARECFHGIPRIFTDDDQAEVSTLLSQFSSDEEDDACLRDYIASSRININIRQVN